MDRTRGKEPERGGATGEGPAGGKPQGGKPEGAKPGTKRRRRRRPPRAGQPQAGQARTEKPRTEKPRTEKPRAEKPRQPQEPTGPRWKGDPGPKICRKCGGRMYPADWIWQKYGLCLGWRCADCKEKVLARSLPFKGLRKRTLDSDEIRDIAEAAAARTEMAKDEKPVAAPRVTQPASRTAGRRRPDRSK